jgi:hypothetical protein
MRFASPHRVRAKDTALAKRSHLLDGLGRSLAR